jgi:fucose permease
MLELAITLVASSSLFVFDQAPLVLWFGTAAFGFGLSAIFPTVMSLCESFVDLNGRSASAIVIIAAIGEMVFPLAIGYMTTEEAPLWFAGLVALIMLFCYVMSIVLIRVGNLAKKENSLESLSNKENKLDEETE